MHLQLKKDYDYIMQVTSWLVNETDSLKELLQELSLEERVDFAYAMREIYKMLDESRKAVGKLRDIAETLSVAQMTERDTDKVETIHCTATANVKPIPQYISKSKDPEKYDAVLYELFSMAKPSELIKKGVITTRFEGFCDFLADQMKQGKGFKSLDMGQTSYKSNLTIRKRKVVSE